MELFQPGPRKFTDLADVPSSYAGSAGLVATVNAGATGLQFSAGGGGGTYTPKKDTGTVSGTSITLTNTPLANTLVLNINGQIMLEGTDFTLTGANITGLPAWTTGNNYQANYAI